MENLELVAEADIDEVDVVLISGTFNIEIFGGPGNVRDFAGVYRPNDPANSGPLYDWKYLGNNAQSPRPNVGKTDGNVTLVITDLSGVYEIRFCTVNGEGNTRTYTTFGKSNLIRFTWPQAVSFSPPPGINSDPDGGWTINIPEDNKTLKINPI